LVGKCYAQSHKFASTKSKTLTDTLHFATD
jgi:hypothetical protein